MPMGPEQITDTEQNLSIRIGEFIYSSAEQVRDQILTEAQRLEEYFPEVPVTLGEFTDREKLGSSIVEKNSTTYVKAVMVQPSPKDTFESSIVLTPTGLAKCQLVNFEAIRN